MTVRTESSMRAYVTTLERLIAHCEEQQRLQENERALVTYKMPGVRGNPKCRRLVPNKGPLGEVLATTDAFCVVGWKADELLAFLRPEVAQVRIYLAVIELPQDA
jgi:hypothetical protein